MVGFTNLSLLSLLQKPSGPPPDNMAECRICSRYFNEDRIAKHETICEKSKTKKRKVFDVVKHRVKVSSVNLWTVLPRKDSTHCTNEML